MTIIATREIDDLGRVLLPVELRREKMWIKGDLLAFYKSGDTIIIDVCEKAKEPQCKICGKQEQTLRIGDDSFCEDCAKLRRD